jgi:hypothetical protein
MSNNQPTVFINDLGQAAALVSRHYDIHLFSVTNYS